MKLSKQKIALIGAGSWGTALALLLAEKGSIVTLWVHGAKTFKELTEHRENRIYLPGIKLPESLFFTTSFEEALNGADALILVPPSHFLRKIVEQIKEILPEKIRILIATKGIENKTLKLPSQILDEILPCNISAYTSSLSGPTFAKEVALKLPSAAAVASREAESASYFQKLLGSDTFRVYTNSDLPGVEIGGALKNVIAIASGISDGMGNGNNARSALITRGLAEMIRLGSAMGANPLTFSGLTGLGDLVLTSTGDLSRNRNVGIQLGQGRSIHDILKEMSMVAEGVKTTESAVDLAKKYGVDLPLIQTVYEIIFNSKKPKDALTQIMRRDFKEEFY